MSHFEKMTLENVNNKVDVQVSNEAIIHLVGYQVSAQVWDQVEIQVEKQIRLRIEFQVRRQMWNEIWTGFELELRSGDI